MTTNNRIILDDRIVKSLKPRDKAYYTMDEKVVGFGVRVTPSGTKTFILRYRFHGRPRWHKIGFFGDDSTISAREHAKDLKADIRKGIDPEAQRTLSREVPTFKELCECYLEDNLAVKPNQRHYHEVKALFNNCLYTHIGNDRVSDYRQEDYKRLHRKLAANKKYIRANRAVEALRAAFYWSDCERWVDINPFKKFPWFEESPRGHYLNDTEIKRLLEALDNHPVKSSASAIRLMIYTGARRGEVLKATWQQFDLEDGRWTKPANLNKSGKQIIVPLSDSAVTLLREIKKAEWTGETYLFPNKTGSFQANLSKSWRTIRKKAQLVCAESDKNVRLHDLRHTFASGIIEQGFAASVVTACLGHLDPNTAHRYIHVNDNIVRNAVNAVGKSIDDKINPDGLVKSQSV